MIEGPIFRTRGGIQNAAFGKPFLTAESKEAEIKAALNSRNVFFDDAQMKRFAHLFRKAAKNLSKKWEADTEKGTIRPSLAALLEKHEMNNGVDKLPPALAADWALSGVNKKRTFRQQPVRSDPRETQREENQRYWTEFMKTRQNVPK